MIDVKHIAKYHSALNAPLDFDEAYELGRLAIIGCQGDRLAQLQSLALLTALHNRSLYNWQGKTSLNGHNIPASAANQIAGICAAIFDLDISQSEFGFLRPNVPYAMDNCGMGGDLVVTANISTIAAFIAAAAGIPMCKHGSPANADQGRHGSSDFISSICGIDNYAHRDQIAKSVETLCFGYTEACDTRYKQIHVQTHKVALMPHMNDIIGPITNPLDPKLLTKRVLGLNHLIPPRVAAEAYLVMNEKGYTNLEHGFFVRGFIGKDGIEGIDEVSICEGGTQVAELINGEIREYRLYANDFGIEVVPRKLVSPPGSKGDYSQAILRGEINGQRLSLVLANAALLFRLAGYSEKLVDCYRMAEEVMKSGKPYETMLAVRSLLPA